ncbi:MAG: hypothetical protein K8H88_08420 [Sandaracinaceae bacterium]|nr:hypothetical protein [Sandaracinaceae bacterium]
MSSTEPRAPLPARVVRVTLALASILAICEALGTAFSPYLVLHEPLALLALSPDARHVLLVTGKLDALTVLAVTVPRRMLALAVTYGVGAIYGRAALRWAEDRSARIAKAARFVERLLAKVGGPLLLVWPGYTLSLLSGTSRARFVPFMLFTLGGQLAQIALTYVFGEAIASTTDTILAFLSDHLLESTLACVALVTVQQAFSWVRRRRARRRALIVEEAQPLQP